jgi:hypothetical protein
MKQSDEVDEGDELRPEYDLGQLRVRRVGSGRKGFGEVIVHLEPDVAALFPSSEAVHEALRFLIRITRENKTAVSTQTK